MHRPLTTLAVRMQDLEAPSPRGPPAEIAARMQLPKLAAGVRRLIQEHSQSKPPPVKTLTSQDLAMAMPSLQQEGSGEEVSEEAGEGEPAQPAEPSAPRRRRRQKPSQ